MHYVDFDSKTKHTVIRFAIYTVLGLIALAISWLVILAARGYDVDPSTGRVVRNGLVLLWSQPESVDVYVNDVLEDNTPARLPLPVDTYQIKMSKAGYRDWNKTVTLRGSEVIKLNYPRLFPNEIKAETSADLASVNEWLKSSDQETIAILGNANSRVIQLYSVSDLKATPVSLTIPEAILTKVNGKIGTFKLGQWSADSAYLTVNHTNGDVTEYIRINVVDNEFINISTEMSLSLSNVQFDRDENNIMYGVDKGRLRRFNVASKIISAPLTSGVLDYRVAEDGRVGIVRKVGASSSLALLSRDDQISTVLTQKSTSSNKLELGSFESNEYAVVSLSPNEVKLIWLDNDENRKSNVAATLSGTGMQVYPSSFSGRFAVVTSGDIVTVHDFEKMRVYSYKFTGMTKESLNWFDDGHLSTTTNKGSIEVVEFDGKNKTNLGKGLKHKVITDKDYNSFFTLSAGAKNRTNLNVSNLRP